MERLAIEKTYKLFVKNEFVRSESGHSLAVVDAGGTTNVARASRKDARDAVLAAKDGHKSWSGKTAYLRGQVLYRLAEVMEGRRAELLESRARAGATDAAAEVDAAIDRVVHYAGWADKYASVLSSANPVAGPHFNVTSPEPMGVVVVVPPEKRPLLGLVSSILPVIVSGNSALVLAAEGDPRTAIVFCECVATSDLPAGVINVLTGVRAEVLPHLAKHLDVQGLDLWKSATLGDDFAKASAVAAADNVKRVKVRDEAAADADGLGFVEPWLEQKTVWHPVGL